MFHNSYPIQNLQGIIHTRKQSRTVSCELIIQVLENVITVFERNISKLYCAVFWVKVKFVLLIQGKLQNEDWISVLPRELWVLSTLRIIDWKTTAFHSSSQTHLKKKKERKKRNPMFMCEVLLIYSTKCTKCPDLDMELVVPKEEGWGEGIVRALGMDMHTLKWITNKDLL